LKDTDAKVRREAAQALWSMSDGAKDALWELVNALHDPNPDVRLNAAGALGDIGPDGHFAVAELTRALKDANPRVREEVARSLGKQEREAKDATSESRREVDRLHLQLQNLYYEQRHLRGEITACRDFPHRYTSLPLVSEADFLAQQPQHRDTDPHNLMIARLNNEKIVREELEKQRKELLVKKQALTAENKKRKDDLASLDEQLKKFIESSRSIQTTFQKDY